MQPNINHRLVGVKILLMVASFGLLVFIIFAVSSQFYSKIFKSVFEKKLSNAYTQNLTPKVDLKVKYQGELYDGVLNTNAKDTPVSLIWTTSGKPTSCIGRSYGLTVSDESWIGFKNPLGGSADTGVLNTNNAFVYSIDCKNDNGDSSGDNVTINIGAKNNSLEPFISTLNIISSEGSINSSTEPFIAEVGSQIGIAWSASNLTSAYSICVSSGSWPRVYQKSNDKKWSQKFDLDKTGVYRFNLYCSNESSFTNDSRTIIVK